jgi:hypothetical protein
MDYREQRQRRQQQQRQQQQQKQQQQQHNDKELSTPVSKPKAPAVPVSSIFSGTSFLLLLLMLFSCL